MDFDEYKGLLLSDFTRYKSKGCTLLSSFLGNPGFRHTCLVRTTRFLFEGKRVFHLPLYAVSKLFMVVHSHIYKIKVPFNTTIGPGFYIDGPEKIVISPKARIGNNCCICRGVTIHSVYMGKHPGAPVIKDNVYIGPDSRIVGGIEVGHNVSIRPKSIVSESVHDNLTVMTLPDFLGIQEGPR